MEAWPKQRVWTGTLLSGPDTIVVTAVNHIQAEKPDPPQIDVAKKVSITVKLPSYLKKVTGFEVTEDGVVPFDCHVENGNAILRLKAIESGRVFLLRRSEWTSGNKQRNGQNIEDYFSKQGLKLLGIHGTGAGGDPFRWNSKSECLQQ